MNDLYLIGNGFDLAHGLETSYNHFLLWYLKDSIMKCNTKGPFEDKLLTINRDHYIWSNIEDYTSIKEMLGDKKRWEFSIKYRHDFFKKIVENYRDYKLVDIEYEYYMKLVDLYKELDEIENRSIYELGDKQEDKENKIKDLKELNNCFAYISDRLEKYLDSVNENHFQKNGNIEEVMFEEFGIPETREREYFEEVFDKDSQSFKDEKLFVCFNYTKTVEVYLRNSSYENNLIHIHGKLYNQSNPIIFGYGDEMDPQYEKIENLNKNEFLKNIKSFNYFKTDNYQRVMRFVEGKDREFTIKILGHSCGLSDRILLNTLFEHPNCQAIKIYYYQKSETENDHFEKTQEISRHFRASMKGKMREKIVPFVKSIPLPQNPKKN